MMDTLIDLISLILILLGFSATIFIVADLILKGRASEMVLKFIEKRNGVK
jgi:hypothetical protein